LKPSLSRYLATVKPSHALSGAMFRCWFNSSQRPFNKKSNAPRRDTLYPSKGTACREPARVGSDNDDQRALRGGIVLAVLDYFRRLRLGQSIDLRRFSPACHAGGRGFEPRLSRHHFNGLADFRSFKSVTRAVGVTVLLRFCSRSLAPTVRASSNPPHARDIGRVVGLAQPLVVVDAVRLRIPRSLPASCSSSPTRPGRCRTVASVSRRSTGHSCPSSRDRRRSTAPASSSRSSAGGRGCTRAAPT